MTFPSDRLERLERDSARFLDLLAARPRLAAAVLLGLALVCYLLALLDVWRSGRGAVGA